VTVPTRARRRVAILGGGCGGLAAAWSLTATPELRERFEVTVYERGWRLGGKGASGRSEADGSGARRIEEHGLHIWFGFYAHAFRMLKEAYEEAGLASGEDWWMTPFAKCDTVSFYDHAPDQTWVRQTVTLIPEQGPPPIEHRPFSTRRALARACRMVAGELGTGLARADVTRGASRAVPAERAQSAMADALQDIAQALEQAKSDDAVWAAAAEVRRGGNGPSRPLDDALGRLRLAARELDAELGEDEPATRRGLPRPIQRVSARVRLLTGTANLLIASLTGLRAGLGEAPDDIEFRAWLKAHGARPDVVDRSAVLRGLYDLTFAYRDGDKRIPDLAAGRALQSLLWMIDYDGAFMWRMRAGMGDVVFTPLYLGLRQRGVKFHFFSHVTRLGLDPDRPVIDTIELTRVARVTAGPDAYEPLERIGDWHCWPAQPYADQLADGQPVGPLANETLRRGAEFDDVVLAIPVGALPMICGQLADRSPRFRKMLGGARTVRTKALQLWLSRPVKELRGPDADRDPLDPPATAYAEPFDTYCDMSHLLDAEGGGAQGPKGVAYFCAVLPDSIPDGQVEEHVRVAARDYLERDARAFWPAAFIGDEFDWSVLFDPQNRVGPERLDAQYFRANVDPSDRYVRTPAGGVDARLDPDGSGFDNLMLAGDWTHNDIDGGCVEAAVISGQRAGRALVSRSSPDVAASQLPGYVEFGELATAPAPLVCERLRMFGFAARADRERLQALCDLVLNRPTQGALRYAPRFAHVLLVFSVLDGVRSDAATHRHLGCVSYREAAIWIPVVRDGRVRLFMPYLWLDDPIAIATGRELYGFAKTYGSIGGLADPGSNPWPPGTVEELRLEVHGLAKDGPGASASIHDLLMVRRSGSVTRGAEKVQLPDLAALIDHFTARDPAPVTRSGRPALRLADSFAELRAGRFAHVMLKQVRDAARPDRAALQQVVEAISTIDATAPQRFRLLPANELEISMPAGAGLVQTLGIEARQTMRGFAAEFGFRLEPGEIVWPAR
jgi:uncharacterized protein with NAD-binding domain and iron-sulfur cluster